MRPWKMRCTVLMLFIFAIFSFAYGEKIGVTSDCSLYDAPNKNATMLSSIEKGTSLEVVDVFGDYARVTVADVKTKKSYSGYVWTSALEKSDNGYVIKKPGATLRSEPKKGDNIVAYLFSGSAVSKYDLLVTWYKGLLKDSVGNIVFEGWIYSGRCKKIK